VPYIKHIYICDSISFNASHQWSDIDLLFITQHGCIWRARFLSVLIFWLLGIKRSIIKKASLFDLVFYIDEKHTNIEQITLQPEDIYLNYRLAHLIPIYQELPYNIYMDNKRIQNTLPNFPLRHINQLKIKNTTGTSRHKKIWQKLLWKQDDNLWESIIKRAWKPIVIKKKMKHKAEWRWVIISDTMLKFHKDKRKEIQTTREEQKY
jgi:hypothetical protein